MSVKMASQPLTWQFNTLHVLCWLMEMMSRDEESDGEWDNDNEEPVVDGSYDNHCC